MILQAAIQEDVDVIGISSHASNYGQIIELLEMMKENDTADVSVVCGGAIPQQQVKKLKDNGVAEVFLPQSRSEQIVNFIVSTVRGKEGVSI
jgi:methylmalonyl-CoA mutase C-terminal domain/subunit